MGWANCGTDSRGRPIGYAHAGTCDEPGCSEVIHRGLAYACGGMHGDDEISCEGYFCDAHLSGLVVDAGGDTHRVCAGCETSWREENPAAAAAFDQE